MDQRLSQITSDMRAIAEDATATFGHLTGEQLNWKPAENSWSIAQCLDHLIKTSKQFYPEFDKLSAGSRKNTFWESWSPLSGFFGRFLVNAVKNDSKKVKAPSKSIVPPSDVPPDIVERFARSVTEVNGKIGACVDADRQRTVVTSPFLSLMTYRLDDAYSVLVEHSRRHIRQAKRVTETEGFPM